MWSKSHLYSFVFFCVAFSYTHYEVKAELCVGPQFDPNIQVLNDSAIDTAIVLESSPLMSSSCSVRIIMSPKVDGLIVSVENISIINLDQSCDNYIEFGSSPIAKWCNTSDARPLQFADSGVDIVFNFPNNSSYFKLIVTPYTKPVFNECLASTPFKCQDSGEVFCISNGFTCDGIDNCPAGNDETNCAQSSSPQIDIITDSYGTNETITEVKPYETTPVLTTGRPFEEMFADKYAKYNISDHCGNQTAQMITLKKDKNDITIPAILYLSANESRLLKEKDCSFRIQIPISSLLTKRGIVLGIDNINIGSANDSCSDYLLIKSSVDETSTKWCNSNTTHIGMAFKGKSGSVDIQFHAGNHSNSSFNLIVTEFHDPIMSYCISNSDIKCSSNAGKQCVSKSFKCDGHRNCPEGDDETTCPKPAPITPTPTPITTTITPNTTTTKPPSPTPTPPPTPSPTPAPSPTPTPAPTPSPSPTPKPDGLSGGIIALIVIGSLIGAAIVVFIIYKYVKRSRENTGYSPLNE
ncbi:unnamed protein product [Medioppia subpectinata]|uniref:Uncharacterized protein n=1 Tax=Medioppia subpectinata TaxID=1979941 RepID=A0A7R9Q2Z8_9ACAR|nr:unnamed protein product [Medioppia subpectinata]CAG2110792.1 unnamed protein product [Medioppia subpectinata]